VGSRYRANRRPRRPFHHQEQEPEIKKTPAKTAGANLTGFQKSTED
jgi:hypothetical protein